MTDRHLLHHLAAAVLIKLLMLVALWWFFVRDARVAVDAEAAARHAAAPLPKASR
ncbi:cytochrome oxidase putative small subunit CydP [Pseudorhodoferax sp.]|uniref:cytochrome oxidase putative small subunit CydP n=1 Tax=Pseudorhodoferax sp. TaxID=1993553 RepID=UPI0039E62346